ncbi:sulfotransferase domain-containing protein [Sinorhizobium sp. BG8]|uniref:sulfotransferase domain-containing protein n=1 Tax=Sinorhizobium sp. BG8 TaxID=2613773 RepID=UPI00193DCC70|nr:sulfotransferase domain-containing protein [Sinorhizobium sp. BG8]QRM54550.1 sulfotransferase domain-containing protein [Sinorhizobium sp. BG8]
MADQASTNPAGARGADTRTGLRLVMHIGPHKTGTTYMQSNFRHHADSLRERGWLYPKISERTATTHHDLSDDPAQLIRRRGKAYEDLKRVIERADALQLNLLLSSEGFRKFKPAHYKAILELTGDRRLHIVYTLRDPLDAYYSFWAQKAKTGGKQGLPERMKPDFANPLQSKMLNPALEIGLLLNNSGADVTILRYDELLRQNRDIFTYFLSNVLGIEGIKPYKDTANERLPIEMTEFIRMMSIDRGQPTGIKNSRRFMHIGYVMKFLFSEKEKAEILVTVRNEGSAAKRTVEVSRTTPEFLMMERRLLLKYGSFMQPPPVGRKLFSTEPSRWTYYDEKQLRQVPAVARLLEKAGRKTRKTNPALVLAHLTKRAIIRWRMLKKALGNY